jgi:hypothetical protein
MPKIQCLQKKVDDLVGPKYIVDVMSPSISTLVEDENKKTARYYAIANINESHSQYLGRRLSARLTSVKITKTGDVSY